MPADLDIDPADGEPEYIERPEFLERVGIDQRTLSRWISERILEPRLVSRGGRSRQTFTRGDANFGRALARLLEQRRGELRLQEAAAIVRAEIFPPDPGHNPAGPPLTQ